jgi:hypothetical protein
LSSKSINIHIRTSAPHIENQAPRHQGRTHSAITKLQQCPQSSGYPSLEILELPAQLCITSHSLKMHFLRGLVVSLLPFAALAAKKPAADKFQQYHAKVQSSAPLKLDDAIYSQLTAPSRDYSVAVLLTAMESRFNCQLCREFHPEWDLLSKSWTKGDKKGESRLLFGTLDFVDGKNTFQSVSSEICGLVLF